MPTILVRAYAELNDHLPPERRQRPFELTLPAGATVGDALAQLAIPAAEVELMLLDDRPAEPGQVLAEGSRLALFPVFEAFDVAPLVAGRPPLRRTRFAVEEALAPLGLSLRALGFDVRLGLEAAEPGRVLLTLGAPPASATHALKVEGADAAEQLAFVRSRLQLG